MGYVIYTHILSFSLLTCIIDRSRINKNRTCANMKIDVDIPPVRLVAMLHDLVHVIR